MVQWGCASNRKPAEDATAAAPDASASAKAEPAAPARPRLTIAEASAACDRVQASQEIPATCTTDYIDNVPSMIVGFESTDDANVWLGPFAERVGDPFCDAANQNGREARIYVTVGAGAEQRARRWSCELGKWGDWFATAPAEPAQPTPPAPERPEPAATQALADAVRACNRVQANRNVPVSCGTDYVNGVPAMIVGFPSPAVAETYMRQVADKVAGPFCDAANRASQRAAVFINMANTRARQFDCQQRKWSAWFPLTPNAESREPASGTVELN
ncbi:MAG TPA: hypothetical protein VMG12_09365 [Polyangiaceae bacterium]|nr:hypothetical protein [Polyangiaceae bacterium]